MSATNIYMRLITASGPVIGEGLLEGWETSIELKDFSWGMDVIKEHPKAAGAGAVLKSLAGLGPTLKAQMEPLKFTKRFDLSSYHIHLCIDHHVKVLSASITVLHMKPNAIPPHAPGFVLNCIDGYFESASLKLSQDGNMTELTEEVVMNFSAIEIQYLKLVHGVAAPMVPFVHAT